MDYIEYPSDVINTMSPAEEQMLTTVNEITKSSWYAVRLIAIFPDRHVFKAYTRPVRGKKQKFCLAIQYNDEKIVVEESDGSDLIGDIFEKTEEKVWNLADKSISELRKSIDAIDKVIKSLINETYRKYVYTTI